MLTNLDRVPYGLPPLTGIQDGRSDELDAIARDAAGDLATPQHTLRARQDLLTGLARGNDSPGLNADLVMSEPSASRFARELGDDEPA
ncbi:MAG: hypothetical protein M3022_04180 [Actinomycetota bacterium]|nr:hypothetical protein [Actinomycetota bacterium]